MLITMFLLSSCIHRNDLNLKFNNVDSKDIEIYLSAGFPFSSLEKATCIYRNGTINAIPNEYGENDWIIIYKNEKICRFRHFKINRNDKHSYFFTLQSDSSKIFCDVCIKGKSNMTQSNIQFIDINHGFGTNEKGEWKPFNFDIYDEIRARDFEASNKIGLNAKALHNL